MYVAFERTKQHTTKVNNTDYEVKYYQVKKTILKCMDVQLKGLKRLISHRRTFGKFDIYVTEI